MTTLHDAATSALSSYHPSGDEQQRLRAQFLAHLDQHDDAVWKSGPPAHLTTSTFVYSADLASVLLVLHGKAKLWLQPGGHLEPEDVDLPAAALREATEETGIEDLGLLPGIAHLDRHALAGAFGRCREHLDVRYAAIAPPVCAPVVSPESDAVAWWPLDAFPEQTDPALPTAMREVARRLRDDPHAGSPSASPESPESTSDSSIVSALPNTTPSR
ncbi:NUDIX domain-containing protein [Branchiibius sp. NY16-3462-2]|uniref:NUDIX hydrolase n=1 Tax=Branchiibius sp. NY16-3462-2 TaxID=1807500 RepID=UPI0007921E97|nr:NUDIX domain-containing protein [Branchiibius sp. NY16-3462-2]KYH45945.1 hypothetical protein AZH51_09760 [Branchiibius sp. NY16-3462-2]